MAILLKAELAVQPGLGVIGEESVRLLSNAAAILLKHAKSAEPEHAPVIQALGSGRLGVLA